MTTPDEPFEAKAKRLISEAGLSYREVGERMGFPPSAARQMIYRFINGKNPSAVMVAKFAKALNVSVEDVL